MQIAAPQLKQRRLRDQLASRESSSSRFVGRADVANLMLLIDDDLRETATAMTGIEGFLGEAQRVLDEAEMDPLDLLRLCASDEVLERMDTLAETLSTLRRRLGALAATVK